MVRIFGGGGAAQLLTFLNSATTEGVPSLRPLQGWEAMLRALLIFNYQIGS
jgi:hypothetical protein